MRILPATCAGFALLFMLTSCTANSGSSASVSCNISASNYDQSCAADSDCTGVTEGDYCSATECLCGWGTISVSALPKYNADVAKTPIGSGAIEGALCNCPAEASPCCRSGACTMSCGAPADTLPECADAGGRCIYGATSCIPPGPPDACAYSDEICCL